MRCAHAQRVRPSHTCVQVLAFIFKITVLTPTRGEMGGRVSLRDLSTQQYVQQSTCTVQQSEHQHIHAVNSR